MTLEAGARRIKKTQKYFRKGDLRLGSLMLPMPESWQHLQFKIKKLKKYSSQLSQKKRESKNKKNPTPGKKARREVDVSSAL